MAIHKLIIPQYIYDINTFSISHSLKISNNYDNHKIGTEENKINF